MLKTREKILLIILIFLVVAGLIFFLFSIEGKNWEVKGEPQSIRKTEDKLKKSPFSGVVCSDPEDRAFGVILAQYPETMPLSSPSQADVVIEGPVDGPKGISRLLAIYQCQEPKKIGSIRSTRPFFVDLALGFDLIFSSWGGCDAAVSRINTLSLDWLDGRVRVNGAFFREKNIPPPHNGFTSFEGLKKASKELGMRQKNKFPGYRFLSEDEIVLESNPQEIKINYYHYPVRYVYDSKTGNYLRFWNGMKMIDRNTGKQVFAKNVVLMKTKIGVLSPGVADVKVLGEGEATIYQAGREIKGRWRKEKPNSKLTFFDQKGEEIRFVPGPIWIEIID